MSELEKEFPGKIVAANVDATTPQSKEIVKDLGFKNHGLVIRSSKGEALWQQPDHQVVVDDLKTALTELTKKL